VAEEALLDVAGAAAASGTASSAICVARVGPDAAVGDGVYAGGGSFDGTVNGGPDAVLFGVPRFVVVLVRGGLGVVPPEVGVGRLLG